MVFDGEVDVHYGFVHFRPQDEFPEGEPRAGQRNGLLGAQELRFLHVVTGLHTGRVSVRVETGDQAPGAPAPEWEDVVEASLTVELSDEPDPEWAGLSDVEPAGPPLYVLSTFQDAHDVAVLEPGTYRARWHGLGMDAGNAADVRSEADPDVERYLLQLWPAPWSPDAVLREGSETARCWHETARAQPAPPPSPGRAERHRLRQAERDRERLEFEEGHRAWLVQELWGGVAPRPELEALEGRASMLAAQDRALVDEVFDAPPQVQRRLAAWAARRACVDAGVEHLPEVVEALGALDSGRALDAAVWGDWARAFEVLNPPAPGGDDPQVTLGFSVITFGDDSPPPPVAPEATVVDAVTLAADEHPARAAIGAVDAVGRGHAGGPAFFAEVRGRLVPGVS
ncbi:hypothetical protein CLV37_101193 [Kineococcus rhizosphaerae]|uniref:Uncharacterized protein n=1 Tax=Kineococcus rhizosphaerae TaxID=559628 RepID=A0A2T0RA00_9ACTN|nr:hypothetical protein CLV37_101193 [Kineococcus rhizosphaerae]